MRFFVYRSPSSFAPVVLITLSPFHTHLTFFNSFDSHLSSLLSSLCPILFSCAERRRLTDVCDRPRCVFVLLSFQFQFYLSILFGLQPTSLKSKKKNELVATHLETLDLPCNGHPRHHPSSSSPFLRTPDRSQLALEGSLYFTLQLQHLQSLLSARPCSLLL